MSYRFAAPSQVFYNLAGTAPIPGGSITTWEPGGTTTPKATYAEEDLSVSNGVEVALDSSARLDVNVWMDGAYFVEIKDANDVVVWNGEITSGIPEAAALTPLGLNQIWVGDGAGNAIPTDFVPLPDGTGSDDYVLSVTGGNPIWIPKQVLPEIPEPEVVVTTSSVRIGTSDDETKYLIQTGSGTATATNTKSTTASITFATPYAVAPIVLPNTTSGYVTQAGTVQPSISVTSVSTTGATFQFVTQTGEGNSDNNIVTPVAFSWVAFGTVEVAA